VASVHKDPRGRSSYFYAAYTLPNGKRGFKSTKEKNGKKAQRIADQWERASELARRGELTEAASREVLDQIRAIVGDSALPTVTVRGFFTNWLAGKKLSQKQSTSERYEKPVTEFLKSLKEKADKSLSHLTPSDIQNFRDMRIEAGVSLSTASLDMQIIRSALKVATDQDLLLKNPANGVALPRVDRQERTTLTIADIRALLAEADEDWKTTILIGFYTGARLSDATSMTWDQVSWVQSPDPAKDPIGLLTYLPRKTRSKKKVPVPMHPDLEKHILKIAGDKTGALCPSLIGKPTSGRSGLSTQFTDLMVKAGIDRQQVKSSKNHTFSGVSFHSLRHSFATELSKAEVSEDIRMELIGHKSADIHRGYTHVQIGRSAIEKLPSLS
jgi:integrase